MLLLGNMFLAQEKDTLQFQKSTFEYQYKKMYIPVGLMITGVIAGGHGENSWNNKIAAARNRDFSNFENHADDYLQFAPFVAAYGFELAGMKPKTDWKNRSAILIKGQILNLGLVYILKNTLKETRPDGTSLSFPSGHTANAFAGATLLSIEYGQENKWVPYAAYGVASTVGIMRIANNRHYLSDVLFGAGLGILSMKIAYWTHQYQWNTTKSTHDPFVGNIY